MAPTPLVLRVLLILALVLNGIGSAVAAVHAHAAPMDAHQAMDAAPCHDEAPAPAPAQDNLTPGTDECCDGARCDCACPAASATLATIRLPLHAAPPATLAMHRLDAGHRAPALAHPIRPPIG